MTRAELAAHLGPMQRDISDIKKGMANHSKEAEERFSDLKEHIDQGVATMAERMDGAQWLGPRAVRYMKLIIPAAAAGVIGYIVSLFTTKGSP